jgi:anti-sigma factor RsiW
MDHTAVVREKMTERYLLNELASDLRDEFEEHYFDCQECAMDVRAGSQFVEQSRIVLAEETEPISVRATARPRPVPSPWSAGLWFAWFRPALAVPVLALLLVVVVYQNRVNSRLQEAVNSPQLIASAVVNLSVRGTEPVVIPAQPGQAISLSLNVPPDNGYSSYKLDLYSSQGALEWSRSIPAGNDALSLLIPPAGHQFTTLMVYGVKAGGESVNLGRFRIELQNQK